MSTYLHNDFSAGWCPSDSPINGRKNSLLQMDGVELDQNGDIIQVGGLKTIGTAYTSFAHTIFSKFLNTTQYRYLAVANGNVYRNNTSIATGGHATRGAFGYCFDYVLAFSGAVRKRDNGTTATDLGQTIPAGAPTVASAGAGELTGSYEYVQINVFANGSYTARSQVSPVSEIVVAAENVTVTPQNVTSPSNEVWIFRRGGNLEEYYRVKRITSSYTTPFTDSLSDEDALEIGITLNLLALSINSTGLPDDILGVVGPVNQRMLYFTKNTLYFSEVNSPETYDPNRGIHYSDNSTGTEIFLWAKKVGDNIVLIGTTHDIYKLTGTFITLPDGSIDVYLRGLGTKFPSISLGCDVYNNGVCYMSSNGWRIGYADGTSELLVAINLDRLYRGNTIGANPGIPIYIYPATDPLGNALIYDCAVARDKLHCIMPSITANDPTQAFGIAGHVYDFQRKYWRSGVNTFKRLFAQEDGALIGFDGNDGKLKEIEYQFAKTNDGTNRTITLLFNIWDFGLPRNRKDLLTLKLKAFTGATSSLTISYSIDNGASFTSLGALASTTLAEKFYDLSDLAASKIIQFKITGTCADFTLSDITVDYEARPTQLTYVLVNRVELPSIDGKKFRPRVWPLIIDTFSQNVTFVPIIDGSLGTALTINTDRKKLVNYFFKTDVVPTDLGYKLIGTSLFEFYGMLPPELVQIFPTPKQFDQLGPEHFFRYGKIKSLNVRLISDNSANIPYEIFFQDASKSSGVIAAVANVEDSYELNLGKENVGKILRIVLGPTGFNFYRYYAQIQVAKSGRETDMEYIIIGVNNG